MDQNTIYAKTGEGEEAVRQRTRLVQRNLRNILIMVDGHSTVADLAKRFGDAAVVESALAELADSGFIQTAERQPAQEPGLPVILDVAPPPVPPHQDPPDSSGPESEPPRAAPESVPPVLVPAVEQISVYPPEYFSLPPPARQERVAKPKPAAPEPLPGPFARLRKALAGLAQRPKRERRRREAEERDIGSVTIRPIRRGPRIYVSWPLFAVIGVVGLFVVALLAAVLFPYDRYLPDIETQASQALKDQVKVGAIGFSFTPRPNITLRNVEVGLDRHLTVAALRVTPDVFSLLGDRKVIRDIEFDNVSVKSQGLGRLAQAGGGTGGSGPEIRHVTFKDLRVEVGDAVFEGIHGEAAMAPHGGPEKIHLRNADASLKFELQPMGEGYRIAILGSAWKTPFAPNLTIDFLDARGELTPFRLTLGKIDGRAYGGLFEGKGAIDWGSGAALAGGFEFKRLDVGRLLPVLEPELAAEGELSGKLRLEAKAENFDKLADALRVEASFDLKRGAMRGFDLVEAVRAASRSPTRGGITKFEEMSGSLVLDRQAYRMSNLRVSSGLMKAGGQVNISKEKRLSGVMVVELKGTAALVKVPVSVAGTTRDPLLASTRGATPGGTAEGPGTKK